MFIGEIQVLALGDALYNMPPKVTYDKIQWTAAAVGKK